MVQIVKNDILGKRNFIVSTRFIRRSNLKKYVSLLLIIFLASPQYSYSQSKYLIKDKEGFNFILNVDIDGNAVKGFTREKALLDYTSKFSYRAIKLVSTLKYPEIIRFNGTMTNNHFEGTYNCLFSSHKIVGNINGDSISYSLFDKGNKLFKSYKGAKVTNYTKKDYGKLAEDIIKTTEENIFDPKIVQSKKWNTYKRKMISAASKTYDDLEFQIGFFALARKTGFSHYYVVKNATSANSEKANPSLKEINKNTVLLKISSFDEKAENIKPLLDTIQQKQYSTLIIDLRDNPGGNFSSPFLVGSFLTNKELISGFFPNRNWYNEYKRLPNKNDIGKFSMMGDTTQTNSKYGFYVSTKGIENNFKGKTYILANKRTGSAAEALIIGAKEHNLAKIVGENTNGGLLSINRFKVDEDILLIMPVNDFISYNGYRVDQKGIRPDIKTKKGKELETLIEIIRESN